MYRQRYADADKQISYENACDCQRNGILSSAWCRSPRLTDDEEKEIWAVAWYDCGDGCDDTTMKPIREIIGDVWGFLHDEEKMHDFVRMSKEDFLRSYSYVLDYEYEATRMAYDGPYKVTPQKKQQVQPTDTVVEYCSECESEIEMRWNVAVDGFKAFCPVCGHRLMLCDACTHRNGEYHDDCNYCSVTDTCRFNP